MRHDRIKLESADTEPEDSSERCNGLVVSERFETAAQCDEMESRSGPPFSPSMLGLPDILWHDAETGKINEPDAGIFRALGYDDPRVEEITALYHRLYDQYRKESPQ
jgi:hypothetical protein